MHLLIRSILQLFVFNNGSVVKIRDVKHGLEIKNNIEKILHLGDILISFGDFLENNAQLVPSAYVEEFWIEELKQKIEKYESNDQIPNQFLNKVPTLDEALKISLDFKIPLHPHYLYFWDKISSKDLLKLLEPKKVNETSIEYSIQIKKILENLGTPHKVENKTLILEHQEAKIFFNLLFREKPIIRDLSIPKSCQNHQVFKSTINFQQALELELEDLKKLLLGK